MESIENEWSTQQNYISAIYFLLKPLDLQRLKQLSQIFFCVSFQESN